MLLSFSYRSTLTIDIDHGRHATPRPLDAAPDACAGPVRLMQHRMMGRRYVDLPLSAAFTSRTLISRHSSYSDHVHFQSAYLLTDTKLTDRPAPPSSYPDRLIVVVVSTPQAQALPEGLIKIAVANLFSDLPTKWMDDGGIFYPI